MACSMTPPWPAAHSVGAPIASWAARAEEGPEWCYRGAKQSWKDPESGRTLDFRAVRIQPSKSSDYQCSELLPMAIFFTGMGEKPELTYNEEWARIAKEPFVLVMPHRPLKTWWFIDDDSDLGWMRGNFTPDLAVLFCKWVNYVTTLPGIDPARVGLFGFSAGAYAAVELLACGALQVRLAGLGLGGVHGHGQHDINAVPWVQRRAAMEKFDAFLDRVRRHAGVRWIEATHGRTDLESRWSDAKEIIDIINERQQELGYPAVSVRLLEPEDQDVKPSKKRNRSHHNYFKNAFMRPAFLEALLGGDAPTPVAVLQEQQAAIGNLSRVREEQQAVIGNLSRVREVQWVSWDNFPGAPPATSSPVVVMPRNDRMSSECTTDFDSRAALRPAQQTRPADDRGAQHYIFEWDAGAGGKKRKWRSYPAEVQEKLCQEYRANERGKIEVSIEGWRYTVDFEKEEQIAHHTGHHRKIRLYDSRESFDLWT